MTMVDTGSAYEDLRHGYPAVQVEPLEDGDTAAVAGVFEAMGAHSLYYRFHMGVPKIAPWMLELLSKVEPGRQYAAIAWAGDQPVGHAQLVRIRPGVAEIALAVADLWQRQGVGAALFRHLAYYAAYAGFGDLSCYVHPENRRVVRLLHAADARVGDEAGEWLIDVRRHARLDPTAAVLSLPDAAPQQAKRRLRTLALAASGSST